MSTPSTGGGRGWRGSPGSNRVGAGRPSTVAPHPSRFALTGGGLFTDAGERCPVVAERVTVSGMSEVPAPTTTPSTAPALAGWLPVTHQMVRQHDGSVISSHCCEHCGMHALEEVSPAQMIGPHSPGPLERVTVHLIEVVTGAQVAFTGTLTPLNEEPSDRRYRRWP